MQLEQALLVAHVVQQAGLGDADLVGDVLQGDAVEALAGDEPGGGGEDLLGALLGGQSDPLAHLANALLIGHVATSFDA